MTPVSPEAPNSEDCLSISEGTFTWNNFTTRDENSDADADVEESEVPRTMKLIDINLNIRKVGQHYIFVI